METKKFISSLKGFRTRFTKTPNKELELKSVTSLVEKIGGREAALDAVKDNEELTCYLVLVLPTVEDPKTSEAKKSTPKKSSKKEGTREVVTAKNGKTYEIDTIKKTCKRVFKDFSELAAIELPEMDMKVYQRYLRDKFPGEDMPIKKGKLHFRGYRISCTIESGFVIEDTTKKYAIVETPWEGIPSPRELGDFFKRPTREFTQEEMKKAVKLGKELAEKAKQKEEVEEPDFGVLRDKVLNLLTNVRLGHETEFDPATLPTMIPFKRWQKQVKSLLSQWKERKMRYPKFLAEVERITTEETFEIKEKKPIVKFTGACLPEFNKVGRLMGDKLEVDDKLVDAVPFMIDYILHYEPKAMQQVMRYAQGECTDVFLLKNPYHEDRTIEYNKKSLANSAENAQLLTALCASIGLVAPQDLLYEADLKVGDKILIDIDGEWKTRQIMGDEKGFTLSKEIGLLKLDKWIKLPKGE